jgi:hypothetical protein
MWAWLGRIKDTWSWGRFAWQLAGALGITALATSVGGAVWAVILGVPTPIALMAGYCTLVGAVYLAMVPLAFRALSNSPANSSGNNNSKVAPDYKLWSHVQALTLSEASHLWNDRDPSAPVETPDVETVIQVFKDAIKRGELPLTLWASADAGDYRLAQQFPEDHHRVDRSHLKKFAANHNYDPRFLKD